MGLYFSDARAIVAREAASDLVGGRGDISETLAIELLGLGPHASYGQKLSVLLDALLKLAKQNSQSFREWVSPAIAGKQETWKTCLSYLQHSQASRRNLRSLASWR